MPTILRRPIEDYPSVPDGFYAAKIINVKDGKEKNPFSNDGSDRDVLIFKVKVYGGDKIIELRRSVTISWNIKSNMYKILNTLNVLPEKGIDFNTDILKDKEITVYIQNENKNGVTYCNIKQILPPRATQTVQPTIENISNVEVELGNNVDDVDEDAELGYDD